MDLKLNSELKKLFNRCDSSLKIYLDSASLDILHKIKLRADDVYYNTGKVVIEDYQYDILKETLERRDCSYVPPIGAKIRDGENRVKLDYWLGSMDKIKPDSKELERWILKNKKGEYIVEDKLDGVSCLLTCKDGITKLHTRGDGIVGADISYLSKYFKTIPVNIGVDIAVRGELIMKNEVFDTKYSHVCANPRNMVSGRIGAKKIRSGLDDIDFVAYEMVGIGYMENPSSQLEKLRSIGFTTVRHKVVDSVTSESMIELLVSFKQTSQYNIDGIVIHSNSSYERNVSGNPSYSFAFKMMMDDNITETEVIDVEWNVSKWGILKPRVKVVLVNLNGVNISYASGFNGKYISDNMIGKGAVVRITRSGDVIPYIVDVVNRAKKASMPEISYKWNETNVDIITNECGELANSKSIASFFQTIGVKYVNDATVKKMCDHGLDSVLKIVSASKNDFLQIETFKEKMVERTYNNIHEAIKVAPLYLILGASGVFGFGIGVKKIEALIGGIPNILEDSKGMTSSELLEVVIRIEGFSDKSSRKIVENIDSAREFVGSLKPFTSFKPQPTSGSYLLENMKFVLSGFRDKSLEKEITDCGGKIMTSISRNTTGLIVPSISSENISDKVKKAILFDVPIYKKDEFFSNFIRT